MCAWCPSRSKEGIKLPETEVMDGHKASCGCLKLNLGPLPEHMLLTTWPSPQPLLRIPRFINVPSYLVLIHLLSPSYNLKELLLMVKSRLESRSRQRNWSLSINNKTSTMQSQTKKIEKDQARFVRLSDRK